MPTVDDELQRRIHRAAPVPPDTATVEGIYRRKHRRSIVRRASAVGVVVLVLAGALVAFAAVDRPNTGDPRRVDAGTLGRRLGAAVPDLPRVVHADDERARRWLGRGLHQGVGRRMPQGQRRVRRRRRRRDGRRSARRDRGSAPRLLLRCEAFAAPDVNGDGVSEIAVSTAGADGFGVWLYAVTTTPPSIEPIIVSSTFDRGPSDGDPLQFGWADVVRPCLERRLRHDARRRDRPSAVLDREAHARAGADDIDDRRGDHSDGHGASRRTRCRSAKHRCRARSSAERRSTDRRSA